MGLAKRQGRTLSAAFDHALDFVLREEGGYVNHPSDPGGETNFGISKRAFPGVDIPNLTRDQAGEIYRTEYWEPIQGDELPWPEALLVFDTAVNCGVGQAIRWLQRAVRTQPDGILGPITLKAVGEANWRDTVARMIAYRLVHYAALPTWDAFAMGWAKRCIRLSLSCSGNAVVSHFGKVS